MRKLNLVCLFLLIVIINFNPVFANKLIGYWHNWDYSASPYIHLDSIDSRFDLIIVAFAMPNSSSDMTMSFIPEKVSPNEFKSKINYLKSLGKKVLISVGGATASIDVSNEQEKNKFINSMKSIIDNYGFDGMDIDIEHGNSILISGGTISNPSNQSMINLINAIKSIMTSFHQSYSKKMTLTMAPETAYVQGGQSGFGSIWGGYLPIIHSLRDSIDYLSVQLYNSGSMYGIDGNIYQQGSSDFIIAMTEATIKGFNTAGGYFNGLPESKVLVGLPACIDAAGGGYVDTSNVRVAINYILGKGNKPGSYTLNQANGYPNLAGMMTWSINWDKAINCGGEYSFAKNYERIFKNNSIKYNLTINNGSGSGDYFENDTIIIIANKPNFGYEFDKWIGDSNYVIDKFNDTTKVIMPSKNITMSAQYKEIKYKLTVINGMGSGYYLPNSKITIYSNKPDSSYIFSKWTGDTIYLSDNYNDTSIVTIPYMDITLIAEFEKIQIPKYNLTVLKGLGSGEYFAGDTIDIIAQKAENGYTFIKWSGDTKFIKDIQNASTIIVMPSSNITVKAEYEKIQIPKYQLTVINGKGNGDYFAGDTISIVANIAKEGFKFSKWVGDSEYIDNILKDSANLIMPEKNITVTAEYEKITPLKYLITVINGTGTGEYEKDTKVNVTANEPPKGFIFTKWIGDIEFINDSKQSSTFIIMPDKSITIESTYDIDSSIETEEKSNKTIYPQPSSNEINIDNSIGEYEIYDIYGNLLIKGFKNLDDSINISTLNTGNYILKIENQYYKFVVIK